jgi:hypothetical protein
MLKNEFEVEKIFAYAVALEQTGRQKNMIFGWQNIIYILNADKTVLLRLQTTKDAFPEPFGFFASDYDSPNFIIKDGGVEFIQRGTEFERTKKCRVPNQSFSDAEEMFFKFYQPDSFLYYITFHKESLSFLNESLSHIEFRVKDGKLTIIQRDIYSGTIIELNRKIELEGLGLVENEDVLPPGPLCNMPIAGIRTNDFLALFNFNDKIKLYLPENPGYFIIEGIHNELIGIVSGCLYDELGTIRNLQEVDDGRKIKENGDGVPTIDRENKGKILQRRKC